MSRFNKTGNTTFVQSFQDDVAFKKFHGKVHTSVSAEWYGENLTCSLKVAPNQIFSSSIPGTPPSTYVQASSYNMIIHTGTFDPAVGPEGGRIYLVRDRADSTGKTWCVVHSGSWKADFNSTGSDRDFILTDVVAPWHCTASHANSTLYYPTVYACTGSGDPPQSISQISASNVVGWTFYPDAGVLIFADPRITHSFTGFVHFEDNLNSATVTNYTDNGWSILSDERTTTEHEIVLGGVWTSGSKSCALDSLTGLTTGSCVSLDVFRYIGGVVSKVSQY